MLGTRSLLVVGRPHIPLTDKELAFVDHPSLSLTAARSVRRLTTREKRYFTHWYRLQGAHVVCELELPPAYDTAQLRRELGHMGRNWFLIHLPSHPVIE